MTAFRRGTLRRCRTGAFSGEQPQRLFTTRRRTTKQCTTALRDVRHSTIQAARQGNDALREQTIAVCPPWEMPRSKMSIVEAQEGRLRQNTVPVLFDALPRIGEHLLKEGPTSPAWDCSTLHWNHNGSDV